MSGKGSPYRNIVLISQIGINMLVPVFICVAVGVSLPLLILGIAAGARNAYALAMDTIRMDEKRRKKEQEEQIQEVLRKAKDEKNHRQD